ncbi:MAG: NAD-dependent epimerase/dehydratase family protein [Burkholderiales bacterium]|nr:NAD-dependent epimerase/dehydratase family protein [Burkholderiales bacterium]
MRLLVTGAGGFVGRALCAQASRAGFVVRAASREDPNVLALACECVQIDRIDARTDWTASLQDVDVVVHLAARVHVLADAAADPLHEYRQVNVDGTLALARQAATAGVKRFVFVSTAKVHGERTLDVPFGESDGPAPADPYSVSKVEAEQALATMAAETGLQVVVVRPPLVYGPGVKANFLALFDRVVRGGPLPLGAIRNSRSVVFVGNLVDALLVCCTHPLAPGRTFLVADGPPVSTPDLVRRVGRALDTPVSLWPIPPLLLRGIAALAGRSAMASRLLDDLVIDDRLIRDRLGWKPPFTMDEGLSITAAWYRNRTDADR